MWRILLITCFKANWDSPSALASLLNSLQLSIIIERGLSREFTARVFRLFLAINFSSFSGMAQWLCSFLASNGILKLLKFKNWLSGYENN